MKKWKYSDVFAIAAALALLWGMVLLGRWNSNRLQSAMADSEQTMRIVIDPGHGGEDGGAIGCSGARESDLNLSVSMKLRTVLRLLGMEPLMVRTSDTAVYTEGATTISQKKVSDIHNRVELVNRTPGAILVSIHQNFFEEPKYSGAQVFYADNQQSKALAVRLQSMLRDSLSPDNKREAKCASSSIYLMNHIQCEGILVECGFLSNPSEEERLRNPNYQTQLAMVIAAALSQEMEEPNEA